MNPMQRAKLASYSLIFAFVWLTTGCGGSSSETPMPLEPKPHAAESETPTPEKSATESDNVGKTIDSEPASDPSPSATETNNY